MNKNKTIKKLFILLAFIIVLTGCKKNEEDYDYIEINKDELSTISPSSGGTITIPIINYHKIDPLNPSNSSIYYLTQLIYSPMFEYNVDGSIETNLVEHYVLSPDKLTLTLTLKDNLYWHNGKKLTSKDIIYTFNKILSSDQDGPYKNIFKKIVGSNFEEIKDKFMIMEAFDERNIDINFDRPYAQCLDMLTFPIIPADLADGEENKLIGSGAYKLKEIKEGTHIELEKNENYHGKAPYINNVIAKIFDDEKLAQLAFETGQVNIVKSSDYNWAKYQDNPRIKIEEFNSNEMEVLIFNNQREKFLGENGKTIKQAIGRSINKKRIIDRLYLTKAIETSIPLNINKMEYYGLKSDTYYNEEYAKKLLGEIGYNTLNDQGLLINGDGQTIDVTLTTNFSNDLKKTALDFIIEDLRAIGINAQTNYKATAMESLSSEEIKEERARFINEIKSGNFDLALTSINLTEISDMAMLLSTDAIGSGLNYGNYSNPSLDLIFNRLKVESNFEQRKSYYLEAINIFTEDMPIVPLYIKINALLVDDKIQGKIDPTEVNLYKSFRNIFILKQFQ